MNRSWHGLLLLFGLLPGSCGGLSYKDADFSGDPVRLEVFERTRTLLDAWQKGDLETYLNLCYETAVHPERKDHYREPFQKHGGKIPWPEQHAGLKVLGGVERIGVSENEFAIASIRFTYRGAKGGVDAYWRKHSGHWYFVEGTGAGEQILSEKIRSWIEAYSTDDPDRRFEARVETLPVGFFPHEPEEFSLDPKWFAPLCSVSERALSSKGPRIGPRERRSAAGDAFRLLKYVESRKALEILVKGATDPTLPSLVTNMAFESLEGHYGGSPDGPELLKWWEETGSRMDPVERHIQELESDRLEIRRTAILHLRRVGQFRVYLGESEVETDPEAIRVVQRRWREWYLKQGLK